MPFLHRWILRSDLKDDANVAGLSSSSRIVWGLFLKPKAKSHLSLDFRYNSKNERLLLDIFRKSFCLTADNDMQQHLDYSWPSKVCFKMNWTMPFYFYWGVIIYFFVAILRKYPRIWTTKSQANVSAPVLAVFWVTESPPARRSLCPRLCPCWTFNTAWATNCLLLHNLGCWICSYSCQTSVQCSCYRVKVELYSI